MYDCSFHLTFHGVRHLMESQRGKQEDWGNVAIATAAMGLPCVRSPLMRQTLPFALISVATELYCQRTRGN